MLILSVNILIQKVCLANFIIRNILIINHKGEDVSYEKLRKNLNNGDYKYVKQVFHHGEYYIYGEIFDIFLIYSIDPYHINFINNKVDKLRIYDDDNSKFINSKAE
ncbi:MAG: hypothetical protein ACTS81_02325 [Arsenophonus sp. ER-BJ3-MAG3]